MFESTNETKVFDVHKVPQAFGLTLVPFGEEPNRKMPKSEYRIAVYGEWRGIDA